MPNTADRCTTAAVFPAVDMETVPMLIAPGKQDLQDSMQRRQGRIAPYKHTTPAERADATQDDPQLVNAERCSRGHQALRGAPSLVPLKGSPRYLALSWLWPSSAPPRMRTWLVRGHLADELLEDGVGEGLVALGRDDEGARAANHVVQEIALEIGF